MELQVKSTDTRKFTLMKDTQELGTLTYEKWFAFKADIQLRDAAVYEVDKDGFWATSLELKRNGATLIEFRMSWGGHVIVITHFENDRQKFIFKRKGFLNSYYALVDEKDEELAVVKPDYKITKLSFEYTIITEGIFKNENYDWLLFLSTIHCSNYFLHLSAGGAFAAAT